MICLSIIVPVYKVEEYVGQCLESIFKGGADESQYEVVVVNDGTPDRSMDVVHEVCAGHGNVKIVEQENQGLSAARMAGLAQAEGEYVWFVDSDDWLRPGAVKSILDLFIEHPECDVYTMPLMWVKGSMEERDICTDENILYEGKDLMKTPYPLWAIQRHIIRHSLFEKKSLFFPVGLLHEDEFFYRVLFYYAHRVLLLKKSYYYYRQREGSIMSNRSIRSFFDMVSIYNYLKQFLFNEVEGNDIRLFQRDIVSLLIKTYKDSLIIKGEEGRRFRKQNRWFVFVEGVFCRDFSLKERAWIIGLLFFNYT